MKKVTVRKKAGPTDARKPGRALVPPASAARAERGAAAKAGPLSPTGEEDIRDAVSRLKRERIISAAVDLFYANGLSNTTLEAVAERMNVTKPFIYSHFPSKSALLAEICSRGIRASLDALNRVVASQGLVTEKVQVLVRAFMLAVLRNQAHIAIYTREVKHLSEQDREAINAMRRDFDRKLCALLEDGVAAGEFVVEDVQIASLAIGGMVSWSYVWYRPNGRLSADEAADQVAELVLAMIQAKAARRKRTRAAREAA